MSLKGNYPVQIKEAGGGGDCFYYSIWAALTERNLIRRNILPKMNIPLDKEGFMLYFRNYVADILNNSEKIEGIYNFYEDIGVQSILPAGRVSFSTFLHPGNTVPKAILEKLRPKMREVYDFLNLNEIQEWMADIFISSNSVAEFKRRVIESVRTKGNNVQEFEVRIITKLFKERFNIEIRAHYDRNASGRPLDMPRNLPMINERGEEVIHLLVLIGGGGHYQYFSFNDMDIAAVLSLQEKPIVSPSLKKAPSEEEWGDFVTSSPQNPPLKKAVSEEEEFGDFVSYSPPTAPKYSNLYPDLSQMLLESGGKRKRKTVRRHRSIKNKNKNKNKRKTKKGGKKGKRYTYKK